MFNLFKKTKQETVKKDYYLGLIFKEDSGTALIIEADPQNSRAKSISETNFKYSNSWEKIVQDVDEVLYKIENENNLQMGKVIYFLYSNLVDQSSSDIKKPYKSRLGSIAKDLELKLLGFTELHEAISVYFKKKEEVPLTSIIIEVDKASISLFIYKGGEIVFSETTAKTENLTEDIETIFGRISGKIILPSRIILYDSENLGEEAEKIASRRWNGDLFIQIPKVEIVKADDLKEAILQSVSQQIFDLEEPLRQKDIDEVKKDQVLGFVIGKDIGRDIEKDEVHRELKKKKDKKEEPKPQKIYNEKPLTPVLKEQIAANMESLTKLLTKLKNMSLNVILKFGTKPKLTLLTICGILIILFGIFSILYFFHSADITVYFEGKKEEKQIDIEGQLNIPSDKKKLGVNKLDQSVSAEESVETTGKKTIGEKAKGEVTVHSWDTADKTFKKSTLLTSPSGIKFVLDNEIKVASASEVQVGVKQTGKAKASATAAEIGTEGNISQNQKLKIEDFSINTFFALPNNNFSGGSKKDIRTVSKDDITKVKERAIKTMKKNESSISKNKLGGSKLINQLTKVEISSEKYSKEVGEEGKSLKLTTSGKLVFYSYDDKDLKNIIIEAFEDIIPKNYEMSTKNVSFRISDAETENKNIKLTVEASVLSLLKVDRNRLIGDVSGKNTNEVEKLIKDDYKGKGFDARIRSPIPLLNSRMPFFKKNINLKIEAL